MHLDRGRGERERLDLDPHDLLRLQLLEYLIENAVLGSAIHPRVDRVPAAETLRQTAPFAALLSNIIQHRVQDRTAFHFRYSDFSGANHESPFEFASQDCSAFLISMTFPSEWSSRSSEGGSLYGGLPDPKLLDSETGDFQPDPRSIQQLIWRV
jgi:hypothetical protein